MSTSHRDPAVEVKEVNCATCQTSNPVARRFCGRCGQRLWEPCSDCGTPNATDQHYCGNCGVSLKQAYENRVQEIKARLARFEQLRREARYLEALATLSNVEDTGDTRLQPLLAQVQTKLESLSGERAERSKEVAEIFSQAQAARSALDYVRAEQLLQQIPIGLRDRAINAALEEASATVQEMRTLADRIKSDLRTQKYDGLLPHVNRLLELQPGDTRLTRLAAELEKRQRERSSQTSAERLALAKKLLLQGRYTAAADQLAAVAVEHVAPNHRKLYDVVLELNGLTRWLKQEPYLHSYLPGIAQRWQRLRPEDADATRIIEQVRKRLAAQPRDPRFPQTWARRPESTTLGCPIQWWRGLKQVRVSEDAKAYDQSPSRFMVAYGLAMQGLEVAPLKLNLLRQRNQALLEKLSALRKSGPPRSVWGCDLGSSGLKAVELQRDKESGQLLMVDAVSIPHETPLGEAGDEEASTEIWRDTMTRFVEEHVENQASVVVGFSGPRSLGRTFEIPRFKSKKAEEAIAYEARMQIPIPAEDIVYDWHTWPLPDDQASFQQVTLLAARRDHVTQVVDACAGLPIKVTAIQSVCLALYNAVMAEFFSPHETSADEELSAAPVAVLDVGVDCSSLIIAAPNLVRHRSLPLGTFRWDRALMSRFKLTRQQADRLRQQPTSAQWMYQVDDVGRQAFGELAGDLRRTLRVYEGEGIQISRLLVTGGGSETFGLLRHLIHGG